ANLENVVRIDRTFGQTVTGADSVALVHAQVLAGANFVQTRLRAFLDLAVLVRGMHEDLALATLDVAEPDDAVDLGDRRRILRTTGFEELGDARQAARDVAGFVRFTTHLRDRRTGADLLAVFDDDL